MTNVSSPSLPSDPSSDLSVAHEPHALSPEEKQLTLQDVIAHSAQQKKHREKHQKLYTQSDLQKAVNDDRAARGRTKKIAEQETLSRIEQATQQRTKELQEKIDALTHQLTTLCDDHNAYQSIVSSHNKATLDTLTSHLKDSHKELLSSLHEKITPLSPLEAHNELTIYKDIALSQTSSPSYGITLSTPGPVLTKDGLSLHSVPERFSPLDRLRSIFRSSDET